MNRDFSISVEGESEEHKEVLGETQFREAMETVCGFLNNCGGKVAFGVNKSGKVVGLDGDLDALQQKIYNEIRNHFRPNPHPHISVSVKENLIFCFVEKGRGDIYQYRNTCYLRTGSSTHALSYEETKALEKRLSFGIRQIAPQVFTNTAGPEVWRCNNCKAQETSASSSRMYIGSPPINPSEKPCPSCGGTMRKIS